VGLRYSTISRIVNPQAVDGGEEIGVRVQFRENSSRHFGAREQESTLPPNSFAAKNEQRNQAIELQSVS
jgi:hypothetical protein